MKNNKQKNGSIRISAWSTEPCEADPCGKFNAWIAEPKHNKGAGTYYENNNSLNSDGTECSTGGFRCNGDGANYYFKDANNQIWYWDGKERDGIWRPYNDCGIDCLPVEFNYSYPISPYVPITSSGTTINNQDDPYADRTNWCSIFILAALTTDGAGTSPCDIARYAYEAGDCFGDTPISTAKIPSLYGHYGLNVTRVADDAPISSECDLVKALSGGGKAVHNSFDKGNGDGWHANLIYGISRNRHGEFKIDVFDSSKEFHKQPGVSFSNFHTGGIDFVITK
jgi:hypothetical protein